MYSTLKASELIRILQYMVEKHGDCEIFEDDYSSINNVDFEERSPPASLPGQLFRLE